MNIPSDHPPDEQSYKARKARFAPNSLYPTDPGINSLYMDSFSAFGYEFDDAMNSYGGLGWRRSPLGACYTVWANICGDSTNNVDNDLNKGWVQLSPLGVAQAMINLPKGFSTVYFPIVKGEGSYSQFSQLFMKWRIASPALLEDYFGATSLVDFPDSCNPNPSIYTDLIYSAMVTPVVCYSSIARQVQVEVNRNYASGPLVSLGRPIALKGACSWLANQ